MRNLGSGEPSYADAAARCVGTPRLPPPSQISRMQVTSTRGDTTIRATCRLLTLGISVSVSGRTQRNASTGATSCLPSTEEGAAWTGGCDAGTVDDSQHDISVCEQHADEHICGAFTAQADASGSDPKVKPSRSRRSSGKRTNIGERINDPILGAVNAAIAQCRT